MSDPPLLPQALRLVRRELRTGLRGFGIFLACLFLGVFAISAIGSFTAAARAGLLADASALLGGDLEIRLAHRQLSAEQAAFISKRGEVSLVSELRTMAATAAGDQRALVELKAIDKRYPLYGRLLLSPSMTLPEALGPHGRDFGAVAERALLQRLGIEVGDRVRVGEGHFIITAVIDAEPDRAIRAFNLGPRLMVSEEALAATGLLQPGSLVNYAYRLRLTDRGKAEAVMAELKSSFPQAGWRLRSWSQAAPRVHRLLERLNLNLSLLGLCALLVGGLGVSGAVRGYLADKVFHIATMKCVGASGRLIFSAYLLQVLVLGVLGAGAGLAAGAAVPYGAAALFGARLPFPLQPAIFPGVLLTAALFGLGIALVFSLSALGTARRVPPAVLFRGYADGGAKPDIGIRAAIAVIALALAALVVATSSDRRLAAWFILGAGACFVVFRLFAAALISGVARLPRPADPRLRLGLANIHRRGSPAASAIFSLGLGLTSLVVIALVQVNLDDLVGRSVPEAAPAYFFLDIQPDQVAPFERTVRSVPGVSKVERYPTLRGRITAISGVPVEQARISSEVRWAVRGDRFLSYAAAMPAGTVLVAGQWWLDNYSGPPLISLTSDLAEGFGVGVGDTLTVNVLGRDITARIASLREVDWSTLELDFAILFSPGVLEAAPQTHIAAVHVPPSGEEAVFRAVTDRFPNVSAIGIREVLANVARTIDRIGGAFRGMAAVALLSGLLVLAGAISADQHRRIQDAVIFKVCGATRRDILASYAFEFLVLGLAAGLLGTLVGALAALGVLKGPMDTDFHLHPLTVLITVATGICLTLVLGLLGTWKALGQSPASYLREE